MTKCKPAFYPCSMYRQHSIPRIHSYATTSVRRNSNSSHVLQFIHKPPYLVLTATLKKYGNNAVETNVALCFFFYCNLGTAKNDKILTCAIEVPLRKTKNKHGNNYCKKQDSLGIPKKYKTRLSLRNWPYIIQDNETLCYPPYRGSLPHELCRGLLTIEKRLFDSGKVRVLVQLAIDQALRSQAFKYPRFTWW